MTKDLPYNRQTWKCANPSWKATFLSQRGIVQRIIWFPCHVLLVPVRHGKLPERPILPEAISAFRQMGANPPSEGRHWREQGRWLPHGEAAEGASRSERKCMLRCWFVFKWKPKRHLPFWGCLKRRSVSEWLSKWFVSLWLHQKQLFQKAIICFLIHCQPQPDQGWFL